MKVFLALALLVAPLAAVADPHARAAHHRFERIVTIFLENVSYGDAARDPYLSKLARRGTFFKNYNGVFHPSYANYLGIIGGNYFWTWLDKQKTIDEPMVGDLLEAKGYTWKNYAEAYPGNCFLGTTSGKYARRHVPFLSFKSVQRNPARCARVVEASEFERDWAAGTLPNYSFYTPDNNDNGHDTGLGAASAWLEKFLEPLLADEARMQGTLFFVTFDESDSILHNHVFATAVGPSVKAGYTTKRRYDHYSHLRMVEDNFGLDSLDVGDDFSPTMDEIFR